MPQDFFTLNRFIPQLKKSIIGAKVNKINEPSNDDLIISIYNGRPLKLHISTNAKLCHIGLTNSEFENPVTPPNFCMLLRKYLIGSEIIDISLLNEDRIVEIVFSLENDFSDKTQVSLILEIMGKYSNCFLVEKDKIIGCQKNIPISSEGKRITLYGATYTFVEKQDKLSPFNKQDIIFAIEKYQSLVNEQDLAFYLYNNFLGLSKLTCQEIAFRILNSNFKNAVKIFEDFINQPDDALTIKNGDFYEFLPFDYTHLVGQRKSFDNLILAQEEYYENLTTLKNFNTLFNLLSSKLNAFEKKLLKKLSLIEEKQLESANYEKNKLYGQLILDNLYLIKKGDKTLNAVNYYTIPSSNISVPLDQTLTPVENSKRYFKKYSKQKKSIEYLTPQKQELLQKIDYIKSIIFSLSQSKTIVELKEIEEELILLDVITTKKVIKKQNNAKKQYSFRRYEVDGYLILCGKNNLQNDALTFSSDKNDTWFHVKDYHSSHVIVKGESPLPNKVTEVASQICAYYSKASDGDKIAVDYTLKKFVKKPPKSNLGSVIYTDYKTVFVTPKLNEEYLIK